MSDQPEQSEKTEDPSQKKLEDALKKGDVVKSQEVTTLFMVLGSAAVFAGIAPMTAGQIAGSLAGVMEHAHAIEAGGPGFSGFVCSLVWAVLPGLPVPPRRLGVRRLASNV